MEQRLWIFAYAITSGASFLTAIAIAASLERPSPITLTISYAVFGLISARGLFRVVRGGEP